MAALVTVLAVVSAACGGSPATTTTPAPVATTAATTTQPPTTAAPTTVADVTTITQPTTSEAPAAFPVTVAASNGDIEIPARPERIVSLSATHTEMIYAIGAGDQVTAVDLFSNFPEGAPITNLTGFTPNVEAIVDFDADLVVFDGDWDGSSVAALTELGIPVLVLEAAVVLDDVYDQIEKLGAATGHVAEATELVGQMDRDISEILAEVEIVAEPITFYHELDTTFFSVTSATFIGGLYESMGLVNIADVVGDGAAYTQLSEEFIIEENPDLIFLADTICCGVNAVSLGERPGWAALTAVQNGAVVELSDDVASRWGPRIVDYIRTIADALNKVSADA
jgi:iron complex transport system substrate-binding protein